MLHVKILFIVYFPIAVLTELLFSGVFNELSPAQCAALISCFAFQENVKEVPELPANLAGPFRTLTVCISSNYVPSRDSLLASAFLMLFNAHLLTVLTGDSSPCRSSQSRFEDRSRRGPVPRLIQTAYDEDRVRLGLWCFVQTGLH